MADLITVEEYKTHKGITKNDDNDKIDLLIKAVSSLIQAYIGFNIGSEEREETIVSPLFGSEVVHLTGHPINEIISIEELGPTGLVAGLDSTVHYPAMIPETGYYYNPASGGLIRKGRNWSSSVKVTYTTGYSSVPADLKAAAIYLVEYYLKGYYIQSKSLAGASISNIKIEDIPPHVKLILDAHKI